MANAKKIKLIVLFIISVCTLLTAVVATYTWYVNHNVANTNEPQVESSTTPSVFGGFPDGELNTEKYYGQTGVQYGGEDHPYILTYSPVTAKPMGLDAKDRYLTAGIQGIKIVLASKDEHGNRIEEIYLLSDEEGVEMIQNFTFRMRLTSYYDGYTNIPDTRVYKHENGFIVNEQNGQPLLLESNFVYYFDLEIVFLSEEGYYLLMETESNIDNSYAFPLSNPKYMFSNIKISYSLGLAELYKVNLNTVGGQCDTTYIPTTGGGAVLLPNSSQVTKENHTFLGWYLDADYTIPFDNDFLKSNPIDKDITIYAHWEKMLEIKMYNSFSNPSQYTSVYIRPNTKLTQPSPPTSNDAVFVGWSINADTSYQEIDSYQFNFNNVLTQDTSVYAVWRKKLTITLHITQYFLGMNKTGKLIKVVDNVAEELPLNGGNTYDLTIFEGETLANYFDDTKDEYYIIERKLVGISQFRFLSTMQSRSGISYYDAQNDTYDMDSLLTTNIVLYAYYTA